ncbi:MAG: hypothetical protein CM15mV33_260 [uncultured marine virus]|nr:MAG: hypothetical protein CM15mV33_260 [uncultured marine virus]
MRDKSEFVDVELETGLAVRFLYLGNDRLGREYAEWDFEEESILSYTPLTNRLLSLLKRMKQSL